MRVDCLASQSNYLSHLLPVFDALPAEARGTLHVTGDALIAVPAGVEFSPTRPNWRHERPLLVASYADMMVARPRPVFLMEHGAGQTYAGVASEDRHPSYAGGREREHVALFLCPNQQVADANAAAYPDAACVVVGSPYLDWLAAEVNERRGPAPSALMVTFHFDCRATAPEARSARPHWWPAMGLLVAGLTARGVDVVGHGHPKDRQAADHWRALGVRFEADLPTALAQAAVLMADNTSVIFEAAALDIPVVLLDAPWYRTEVEHGLRFYEFADIGPRPDATPAAPAVMAERLAHAIAEAGQPMFAWRRQAVAAALYDDSQASRPAQRAAAAILGAMSEGVRTR